jgi:Flp pilus assembly protein protease CpaA
MTNLDFSWLSFDDERNPLITFSYRDDIIAPPWVGALFVLFMLGLWVVSFIDVREHRIPNWFTLPGIIAGLALLPLSDNWLMKLLVAIAFASLFLVFALRGGAGMGDVKLYLMVCLLLGIAGAYAIFAANILAAVVGLVAAGVRRERRTPIPMAPFVAAGTILVATGFGLPWMVALAGVLFTGLISLLALASKSRWPVAEKTDDNETKGLLSYKDSQGEQL